MTRRRAAAIAAGIVVLAVAVGTGAYLLRPETPTEAAGPPTFVDETAAAGLNVSNDGDDRFQVGGGVAVFDCDGDRKPELYVAGGAGPAALLHNDSPVGGRLRFSRISSETELNDVNGAYPIDLEGDGRIDLAILRVRETILFRNDGDCSFSRANAALHFPIVEGHSTAFSATWERDSRLPTLAIGHYLRLDENGVRTLDCDDNALVRPDASGSGYGAPIPLVPGYCSLSMLFSDWDGSGRRDLRVTNDREWYRDDGMEQLWRMEPGVAPRLYTSDEGWVALRIWGMGIASQDLTGDRLPEIYLTSQADNKLQTLTAGPSQPMYRDIALRRGVTATQPFAGDEHLPSTAWHPEFADVNNDGFSDLFVSKGNVGEQAGYAVLDPSNLFLGQPDGTFVEAADKAGILSFDRGRGAALADFNMDGLLDLVLVSYRADVRLWRNVGAGTAEAPAAMGRWLELALEDPGSPNRNAIGAWLEIQLGDLTLQRELTIGGGHISGELGWLHVGIGPARQAKVRVTWPDGDVGPWLSVAADEFAIIERGAASAQRWTPGS